MLIDIKPPHAVEVDLGRIHPPRTAVVHPRPEIDHHDDDDGHVVRKEGLGRGRRPQRPDGQVELDDDQDDAPRKTPPGGPRPRPRFPRKLLRRAALDPPRVPEADVREADHAPAEEGEEGGEVAEPAEDGDARVRDVQVGEAAADDEDEEQAVPGPARAVRPLELLGRHAEVGEAHDGAGAGVAADGAGGEDGDEDDGVHEVGHGPEAGVAVGDDEGGRVGAAAAEDVRVVGGDGDGHHQRADEVEEREAQPDGSDGAGDGFAWILGLAGHQSGVLGAWGFCFFAISIFPVTIASGN